MDIQIILNQMIQLMIILIVGFIMAKCGVMTADFNKRLTKLVLDITVPALIFSSVLAQTGGNKGYVLYIFEVAIGLYLLLPVFAFILVKILHLPLQQQGVYMFMTVFSNVGFMGYPIINAVYGPTAVFHASLFNIIFNISTFTTGVMMLHYGTSGKARLSLKKLFTPGLLSCAIAVAMYFMDLSLPGPIAGACDMLGGLTSGLAMLIIGGTLGQMHLGKIFNDWRVYFFALVKQIAMPLALYPLVKLLITDSYIAGLTMLMLCMPVANNAVLFATQYKRGEELASKTVFITTVLSIATVPLVIWICKL